jgi:hypothetical protein
VSKEGHPNERKSKGRGAPNVARSLEGLGQGTREFNHADWNAATANLVLGVVVEVTRLGGMASFSLTRDGGAFVVTVLLDGDRRPVYVSGSEDIDAELEKIIHFLASLPR